MAAVTLDNITISYDRHPAVHHISGTFVSGSLTAIAGPNGAGKSTLLKAIAGIIPLDEGHITVENNVRARLAYMPQASELQRDFPLSVLHMVATGAWHQTRGIRTITPAIKTRAHDAIARVGLHGLDHRNLSSLSTGQFQRVLFARLLMQDAPLILLDEPFTAIDADTTEHLLGLVQQWHKEGRTVICVLHDFAQIRQYFPQCLLLARECIAWGNAEQVLTPEHLLSAQFFHGATAPHADLCERAV